jgi:glycolate oxidase subunit GlcD
MDAAVVRALRTILGREGLIEEPAARLTYESDGLTLERTTPELVLLPRDTDQAARAMRVLAEHHISVVSRGAGTGLSGGARPVASGVIVGTARMREVLEVDPVDRFARVQAGVINVELTRRVAEHGLFYAPDPSSQAACTIGGNVAENSGGPHCFFHGATARHVLGLKIVTAEGEVLDLSTPEIDPVGYDLIGYFVGSEGLLGLVTEVTIRLTPRPPLVETLLAVFPSLDAACDTVSDIIAARLEPSALEILDRLTIEAVEASVFAAGYPADAEAVLLIEIEGGEAEVEDTARDVLALARRHAALEVRQARDAAERQRLWAGRKGAFGAMGRIAPDLYVADVVVPRTRLREIVRLATDVCRERGLKIANVFHAGDGNLHPNVAYDRRDAEEVRRVLEAGEIVMRACAEAGGSLTGEHGVGLEKRAQMCLVYTAADIEVMERARAALDPEGRMNPGKVLPERGCREARDANAPSALRQGS